MIMHIINYIVRLLIITVGLLLIFGNIGPKNADKTLITVMGVILILWGIYRLVTYRTRVKQFERDQRDEDE